MLTDTTLRNLKPKSAIYKVADHDGMYATVAPTGLITFRYDYRVNGRRETIKIGRYNRHTFTLVAARDELIRARALVEKDESPAQARRAAKRCRADIPMFCDIVDKWFAEAALAESTKAMRRSIYEKDLKSEFRSYRLTDVKADDLRALCDKIKARGAPATALHVRDISKGIFQFANLKGYKVANPADEAAVKKVLKTTGHARQDLIWMLCFDIVAGWGVG